jgi:hypothetical protein
MATNKPLLSTRFGLFAGKLSTAINRQLSLDDGRLKVMNMAQRI